MASEVGVVDVAPEEVARKGRLMPGNLFLVDFDAHRVLEDAEVRGRCCQPAGMFEAITVVTCLACPYAAFMHCIVLRSRRSSDALNADACRPRPQVKARYSQAKPYGEWLKAQAVTLDALVASVPDAKKRPAPVAAAATGNGNGNGAHAAAGLQSLLAPLKAFGCVRTGT